MGNEVEARTQRVRDHLQRPDHCDWQLTNARIRSTVYLTAPMSQKSGFAGSSQASFLLERAELIPKSSPVCFSSRLSVGPLRHRRWPEWSRNRQSFSLQPVTVLPAVGSFRQLR